MKQKNLKKGRLPWEKPKPKSEDPKASSLVSNLLNSPTYRLAESDKEFLSSYEARGVRIELDYLKAELIMSKFGIEHTIVVFGSARILEHKTALKKLKSIQKEIEKNPKNRTLLSDLHRVERMVENSFYYDDARLLGSLIGRSGKGPEDCRVILMTGGGPGIMEAANRGSYDVGAKSIGLNIKLPHEQYPNPYITPELCFQFHYFAIRKLHFFLRAKALVVYPGGFGTLDELFEILTLIQTKKTEPIPVVMVGVSYWKKLIDFEFLQMEGFISKEDISLFKVVESAEEAWKYIIGWYDDIGSPLFKRG